MMRANVAIGSVVYYKAAHLCHREPDAEYHKAQNILDLCPKSVVWYMSSSVSLRSLQYVCIGNARGYCFIDVDF